MKPWRPSATAIAAPMPLLAPVTSTERVMAQPLRVEPRELVGRGLIGVDDGRRDDTIGRDRALERTELASATSGSTLIVSVAPSGKAATSLR